MTTFKQIYAILNQPSCRYERDISAADVQDQFGRFNVWAGNIGALQPLQIKSSLENRLRDASRTRQQVLDLLGDLQGSLEEGNFRLS